MSLDFMQETFPSSAEHMKENAMMEMNGFQDNGTPHSNGFAS
jgi:hypothetical protein